MGLPGSGKTTLTQAIVNKLRFKNKGVCWINADAVRAAANDWDFSHEGRIRQCRRISDKASLLVDTDYVICDFIAPTNEIREIFNADFVIWMDTITEGRFEDTNKVFIKPTIFNIRVTEKDSEKWSDIIIDILK